MPGHWEGDLILGSTASGSAIGTLVERSTRFTILLHLSGDHTADTVAAAMIEAMQRHSNRLNAIVEDLLILTRIEARQIQAEFSLIRVDAFFRQLMRDWEKRVDSGAVTLSLEIPENLPPLEVDALRFEQVMLNLLENSVAYSNPPRRIVLSVMEDGNEMVVKVADNGIGIPPVDLPHIFERFYRVDKGRSRASGGTGLGLSIVKHIIQSHGGAVHAESELGKGTTIVIRLPLNQDR